MVLPNALPFTRNCNVCPSRNAVHSGLTKPPSPPATRQRLTVLRRASVETVKPTHDAQRVAILLRLPTTAALATAPRPRTRTNSQASTGFSQNIDTPGLGLLDTNPLSSRLWFDWRRLCQRAHPIFSQIADCSHPRGNANTCTSSKMANWSSPSCFWPFHFCNETLLNHSGKTMNTPWIGAGSLIESSV